MTKVRQVWKKGRGKLGVLHPLLGTWQARASSPLGDVRCVRTFTPVLGGAYVQLTATWELPKGSYQELALFGVREDRRVGFWSFTSEGKRSEGVLEEASDLHPQAIAFKARMPAGLARMAYWPDGEGGFHWVVEARGKKGWKRFTEHHYSAV